jgi:uncharacterized protein YejL (UPF0352 family)
MSPSNLIPANVGVAIPTLLQRQVTIHHKDGITKNMSLMPLSMLILESARRYRDDSKAFGKRSKTLDEALKPIFTKMFALDKHKAAADMGLAVYKKLADQTTLTVANKKLRAYCGSVPSQKPLQLVLEEFSHTNGLHFTALEAGVIVGFVSKWKGRASAKLDGIECKDPEEQQTPKHYFGTSIINPAFDIIGSGDEIYYATFGAVYSKDGYLERTSYVSGVTEHVGTLEGHVKNLRIPGNLKYPVYCELNERTLAPTISLPPHSVMYSFTLFEKEYSKEERRQAMAKAAMDATEAVVSLLTLDWVGFGVNIAQLLYDLAIALDNDDLLGSEAFYFGDIFNMQPGTRDTTVTFSDTHLFNPYKYIVKSHFALESLP